MPDATRYHGPVTNIAQIIAVKKIDDVARIPTFGFVRVSTQPSTAPATTLKLKRSMFCTPPYFSGRSPTASVE